MSDLPDLPTARFGFVKGPLRWENVDGRELFLGENQLVINERPFGHGKSSWAVTHIQKKSRFGFLWFKPFIFHVWFTWRFQRQDTKPDGAVVYVPGSEFVTYGRTPGWRFDFAQAKFIRSRGYFSFTHWD